MSGTVHFSKIVQTAGKPSIHLLWMEPAKDSVLQKAIKANRVMTIHQHSAKTKTDFGVVGLQKGVSGQILIFPKSLKRFADRRVIGVKYDLLESPAIPKSQQLSSPGHAKPRAKPRSQGPKAGAVTAKRPASQKHPKPGREKSSAPLSDHDEEPNPELVEIKNQVRQAIKLLEEDKQVPAFNLLKNIVSS